MKSKIFEQLKTYKLTKSEIKFMDSITAKQAAKKAEKDNLIKQRDELNKKFYRAVSDSMAEVIGNQRKAINNRITTVDREIASLERSRRFYADSYQKKVKTLAEKETALKEAKTAQSVTEQAVINARNGAGFDSLMNAERGDFDARKAVERAEEDVEEAKKAIAEVDDPVQTMRYACIEEVSKTTKAEVSELLKSALKVVTEAVRDVDTVNLTAESVDPLARKLADSMEVSWMYSLTQEIESMILEVSRNG